MCRIGAVPPADDHTTAPELAAMQQRLDGLTQQLFQARDATRGAEAELGAARARIREVEHRLHVTTVEVEELREKMLQLTSAGRAEARPNPVAKRLSPLLARTAKLGQ